jgi:hypothetical protein
MEDVTAQARLLAVEVVLAEPELLANDALEGDLYILRDALRAKLEAGVRSHPVPLDQQELATIEPELA